MQLFVVVYGCLLFQVWTLVIAYVIFLIMFWTPERSTLLKILALPVWIALLFNLTTIAGPFRVPLVLAIVALVITGVISDAKDKNINGMCSF